MWACRASFRDKRDTIISPVTLLTAGFSIADFLSEIPRATAEMAKWIEEGKLSAEAENVVPTPFDKIPETWQTLFSGTTRPGKLITAVQH